MLLLVKFKDNPNLKPFKNSSPQKAQRYLSGKAQGYWRFATLYNKDGIVHYYHHSQGALPLTKEQYNNILLSEQVNFYIIYTPDEKKRRGNEAGTPIFNKKMEDVNQYFTKGVAKILIYQNNKVIDSYEPQKF